MLFSINGSYLCISSVGKILMNLLSLFLSDSLVKSIMNSLDFIFKLYMLLKF